jgi:hypothetical protein
LTRHCTHRSFEQTFVAVFAQSALDRHWTHAAEVVSHFGFGPPHCASLEQPGRQRNALSWPSQKGAAAPQSTFDRHSTHVPVRAKQRGRPTGQSVFSAHWTHWPEAPSQMGRGPAQSVATLQPTHAPKAVSQICASLGQDAFVVQAG